MRIVSHLVVLLIVMTGQQVIAQRDSSTQAIPADSSRQHSWFALTKEGKEKAQKSADKFKSDRTALIQYEIIQLIKLEILTAKEHLKKGLDTTRISLELEKMKNQFAIAGDGIFTNKGPVQTYRNLTSSFHIISELLVKVMGWKSKVDVYLRDVIDFRYRLDSLNSDSTIFDFPTDSVTLQLYLSRLEQLTKETGQIDNALNQTIFNVERLQTSVDHFVNLLNSSLEEINFYQQSLFNKTIERELPNIWEPVDLHKPFSEIIRTSAIKGKLTFLFYIQYHLGKMFFVLFLVAASTIFLGSLKKILIQQNLLRKDFNGQLVLRYPFLSAVVIVLNLFQFIFPGSPFTFNVFFWVIAAMALTIVFRSSISKTWMPVWVILFILFIFACADNLVLDVSSTERWIILLLAMSGVLASVFFLQKGRRLQLREKAVLYFIGFGALLEAASVIASIYGRFNFSKTMMTSGYINVVIAIMFAWTVRLINEGLRLASQVYNKQDKKLFYINFEKVGDKVPLFFNVLLVIGWFILFGRNFYYFKQITDPLKDFLFTGRSVGNYSFTISNALLFFLIMSIAVVISKIVSFFASDKHAGRVNPSHEKKVGVGSWLLLVRITIISVGLFFAVAATNIELDRITIIFGALGVGVGLGLQSLVSNLVSGLIIAFEKPVNVGDIVQIDSQVGTMKSIGFRSSVIATADGADIIVPNGDLLNTRLINWTMGKYMRRTELSVNVAYGTDLEKVRTLTGELIAADERIFKNPVPLVLFQQFGNSSIDAKMLFWIRHKDIPMVKSDLIVAVDAAFKKNGIEIPFPQQDLHIRSFTEQPKDEGERQ